MKLTVLRHGKTIKYFAEMITNDLGDKIFVKRFMQ